MAKFIRDTIGRKVGVQMSVKEYNEIAGDMAALRIQISVQKELLKHKKAVMIAPQLPSSIWHPN